MEDHAVDRVPGWQQRSVQLIARGILIGLLVVPVTLALPGTAKVAFAAPLEDCDADGFDDATGVAVPWPGFDETRGDTAAGPGTADWWIAQNGQSGSGGSGSGSGGSGGDAGSGSPHSGTGAGSSSSGSGNGAASTTTGNKRLSTKTTAPAASGPSSASAAATQATPTATPASEDGSASVESSGVAAAVGDGVVDGPAAGSGSLWEALTIGFTGANKEFLAGSILLAALASAGGLALGIEALRGIGGSRRRESRAPHTDELVVDVT